MIGVMAVLSARREKRHPGYQAAMGGIDQRVPGMVAPNEPVQGGGREERTGRAERGR
ncbi:hypothetical protein SAMN04490356_7900 [Streptomyces melanosporofaciens]|uniref:Uncharacterized protein n=1 Tax=Streptomyces melanosporofaciens TaxID=67327 RepID=A0A1H4ZMP2_STRMJ|nr:hypothetical protein SAMN04490356_7900 [Streptomyces melanosporofaciens]